MPAVDDQIRISPLLLGRYLRTNTVRRWLAGFFVGYLPIDIRREPVFVEMIFPVGG